ncbi:MAG: hypothetical protein AAB725_00730 [Patescibacteria group bacterium]|mgnify:CR=1 FL=1
MEKGSKLNRLGPVQQKIVLLLLAGAALGVSRTPRQYFKVVKAVGYEWKKINYWSLKKSIAALYRSKLIHEHENPDGSLTMVLTDKGKKKAITFNIDNMAIKKPKVWDKKWRLVLFDIPEKHKPAREVLREALKRLGFYEYQKSVLIHPYPCQDEIDYLIEYFEIRPWVRLVTATSLDNELHVREMFGLV